METQVLARIPAGEGIEIDVALISRGYSVVLHDLDADEYFPSRIYKTEAEAMAHATKLAADNAK